jgi:hypothetical protein
MILSNFVLIITCCAIRFYVKCYVFYLPVMWPNKLLICFVKSIKGQSDGV